MEFVFEVQNNLSKDFCKRVIDIFESHPGKFQGRTLSGVNLKTKRSTDCFITDDPIWEDVDTILCERLKEGFISYIGYLRTITDGKFHIPYIPVSDRGYTVQRTGKNGFYKWHSDESGARLYAFIWYLNTLKPEDGGCTEFYTGRKIKPEEGKLLIFPASWTYIHRGGVVLTDTYKYIITGFIHDMRDDIDVGNV